MQFVRYSEFLDPSDGRISEKLEITDKILFPPVCFRALAPQVERSLENRTKHRLIYMCA